MNPFQDAVALYFLPRLSFLAIFLVNLIVPLPFLLTLTLKVLPLNLTVIFLPFSAFPNLATTLRFPEYLNLIFFLLLTLGPFKVIKILVFFLDFLTLETFLALIKDFTVNLL